MYFIYGMHWMLNFVTGAEGAPAAVLVRAIHATEGLNQIAIHRGSQAKTSVKPQYWTDGPARLCQALQIDGQFNGADLTAPRGSLVVEHGQPLEDNDVLVGPRVGIDNVLEPWRSMPWRFRADLQRWKPQDRA